MSFIKQVRIYFNCPLAESTKNKYINELSNFKIFITFDKKSYFRIDSSSRLQAPESADISRENLTRNKINRLQDDRVLLSGGTLAFSFP